MNATVDVFKKNIDLVEKLINFDREVIDMAIGSIQELHERLLVKPYNIDNEMSNGKRTLDILQSFRTNDSLKIRYSTINNQAIVLLVSYFGSAIADLFRQASKISVEIHRDEKVLGTELKIKIEELMEFGSSLGDSIGDLLITKNNISFQDMKSIQREFKKYFGISINKNTDVNNIILSQACRHSIVHEACIVNGRTINQVKNSIPRDLKLDIECGCNIEFSEDEIQIVSNSMLNYVSSLEAEVIVYGNSMSI